MSDAPKAELVILFRRKAGNAPMLSVVADGKLQDFVLTPHTLAALIRESAELLAGMVGVSSGKLP